ncbi:DedA family protein [Deinococcus sp. VB142]|uniref:DedA family protein n=1 Tax=Deinococcus sp. VB142 TaxID=3112952 RepID=A0AAU6Q6G4_9DEIO
MTDSFDLRLWLAGLDPLWLHFATFFLMFLEGAGVPGVPGVLPMLAQVAEIDAGHTTLAAAIFWGTLGNWVGSVCGYGVGRWGLRFLPPKWVSRLQSERAETLLRRWGGPLIVVSRTVGSLRTPVTLVSGMVNYPLGPYLVYSLIGSLIHVGVWQTLLWKFGPVILPQLERWGREIVLYVLPLLLLAVVVRWWWQRRRTETEQAQAAPDVPPVTESETRR